MHKLQFITHCNSQYSYYQSAEMALKSGVRWIQLRMKNASETEFKTEALKVQALCKTYNALFVVNDHPTLAAEINADGVHLGKMDMSPAEARKILGSDKIIGGTANSFADIQQLAAASVNYVGLGPFRFTETKQNLSPVLGLSGYAHIVQQCKEQGLSIPIFAIGGITLQDIPELMNTGIHGIAVSSLLLQAENPEEATKELLKKLE